jgi:hypothetical protein
MARSTRRYLNDSPTRFGLPSLSILYDIPLPQRPMHH